MMYFLNFVKCMDHIKHSFCVLPCSIISGYIFLDKHVSELRSRNIYIVCTLIDCFRIRFIEKPFLKLFDLFYSKLTRKDSKLSNKICNLLHIN